jgi:phospholipid-binding lipoprotein MlaA
VLQTDPQNSFASFWRFTLNTTVGVGGLFDVASEAGLKYRQTDFGQTMAIYGADAGPYIVLPIIGPSNTRDGIGRVADAFMNPFNYVDQGPGLSIAMWSATAVDKRSTNMKLIDDIYRTSLDPYTTFRSGYTQKRNSDIRRAKAERAKSLEKAGF